MRILGKLLSGAIIAVPVILPAEAKPELTGMKNAQYAALKSLGMKMIAPGLVPEGFQVIGVTIEPLRKDRSAIGRPAYSIIYRSPSNVCFQISGKSGGVGDTWGEYKVPVTSKLLGPTELFFNSRPENRTGDLTPSPALLKKPQSFLKTAWFPYSPSSKAVYSLTSPLSGQSMLDRPGCAASSITPQEAMKTVNALEWLP